MGNLALFAFSQGINLFQINEKNKFQKVLNDKINLIDHKLNQLITAPYREAKMLLYEDEYEKCLDKARQAVSLNEFDLPAHLLYVLMLYKNEKIELAFTVYEDLIEKFGPHPDLVDTDFMLKYHTYLMETKPLINTIKPFSQLYHIDSCPSGVYFTPYRIVTVWGHACEVNSWGGEQIVHFSLYNVKLLAITERYLVFSGYKTKTTIININNGKEVSHALSDSDIIRLFTSCRNYMTDQKNSNPLHCEILYAGARITFERRKYERGEPGLFGGYHKYTDTGYKLNVNLEEI